MNNKFYSLLLSVFLLMLFVPSLAQTGGVTIGADKSPHPSAILDLQAANKGFLPPRVTSVQRNAIASPAAGLIVYDTDASLLYFFDGIEWKPLTSLGGMKRSSVATNSLDSANNNLFPAANQTAYDSELGKLLVSDGNVWRDGNTGCLPSFLKKINCIRPGSVASSFDQSGNMGLFNPNTARNYFDLVSGRDLGIAVEGNDTNMIMQSEFLLDMASYNGTTWNRANVTVAAAGMLAGRPRFLITKTDALNYSSFRKLGLKFLAGSTYLVQVLVQRKTVNNFSIGIHNDAPNTDGVITLDLNTGDITGGGSTAAGIFFNAKAVPLKGTGGAWVFSFNYVPNGTANTTHQLRFIPASTTVGEAVYVSSPTIVATNNPFGTYIANGKTVTPRGEEFLNVDLGLQNSGSVLVKGLMADRTTMRSRAASWKASTGTGLSLTGNGFTGGFSIAENGTLIESGGQFLPAAGTTGTAYYIDPTAADSGTGTIDSPFKSLAQLPKLSGNLNGLQILFKRGTLLREQLTMTNCSNFTVNSYGTGPLPILDGSNLTGAIWTAENDVWFITGQATGQALFVNNERFIGVASKTAMTSTPKTSWFDAAAQRIYINPGTGVDPNQITVEITTRNFGSRLSDCSDFYVKNMQFQRARNSGLAINSGILGAGSRPSKNCIVEKCIAIYNGAFDLTSNLAGDGFVWYGLSSTAKCQNNIIRQCISNFNVNCCYEFDFHDSLLVEDNYASRNGQGIELWGWVTNSTFQRNKILNTIPVGISWGHGNAFWMPNSTVQPPNTGGCNNNNIISNVFATTWAETLDIQTGSHNFIGNLFFDPTRYREDVAGTFLFAGKLNGSEPISLHLRNNIFYQPTFQGYPVAAFKIDNTVSAATLDHNFYYSDPSIGGYTPFTYLGTGYGGNFNAYKTATKQDLKGASQLDPKFVKVAGKTVTDVYQTFFNGSSRTNLLIHDEELTDFNLAAGSPCIGAGDGTAAGTVGVNFVPYGTSRSVGPYSAFQAAPLSMGDRWLGGLNFRGGFLSDVQASKGNLPDNAAVIQLSLCK